MRRVGLVLALIVAGAFAAWAERDAGVARTTNEMFAAMSAGDATGALALAEAALAEVEALAAPDPAQRAWAHVNVAVLLTQTGGDGARAAGLFDAARRITEAAGLHGADPWVAASIGVISLQSDADQAQALLDEVETVSRRVGNANGLGQVSAVYFERGAYVRAAGLLEELLAVDPQVIGGFFADVSGAYQAAADAAYAAGDVASDAALTRGRIAILRHFDIPDAEAYRRILWRGLIVRMFGAGAYGHANAALEGLLAEGPLSAEDRAFLREQGEMAAALTEAAAATAERSAQRDLSVLARALVRAAGLSDLERAKALREEAAALANLDEHEAAARLLQQAIALAEATEGGVDLGHLLLADLASSLWFMGDLAQAEALFDRADAAYAAALEAGGAALAPMDRAIVLINRANLYLQQGRTDEMAALAAEAAAFFAQAEAARALKWNDRYEGARIRMIEAQAAADRGDREAALAALEEGVAIVRDWVPADHPDRALYLVNAGDLTYVLGARAAGKALVAEGIAINDRVLPRDMPDAVEAVSGLASMELGDGAFDAARALLARATASRKAPAHRARLPEASWNFEVYAWSLLRGAPGPKEISAAFEAVQWTQVTRSAEALSMMEARLAQGDPAEAAALRLRQDLLRAHEEDLQRMLTLLADPGTTAAARAAQAARLAATEADLAEAEAGLARLGLDLAGIGGVAPMSVADVQNALAPGEVLVTFLLPGLRPDVVTGLEGSANRVIAVTADDVRVAPVPIVARREIRGLVREMRCAMAVDEPGCGRDSFAATRGARFAAAAPEAADVEGFSAASALYQALFGGIDDLLAAHPHLIVVPPSDLLGLPFAALLTEAEMPGQLADAAWLIRRNAVSVLPSVSALRVLRQAVTETAAGPVRYLGVGDPEIGTAGPLVCGTQMAALRAVPDTAAVMSETSQGVRLADVARLRALPRLPDAACEVAAIGDVLGAGPADILTGAAATETAIKALDAAGELRGRDILVFATHGLTAGEAGASAPGLVLTPPPFATSDDDGLLTAAEIAALDLSADLVILSACNTAAGGAGDADGLSGLARAFFHAGAEALMVTHWSVYSDAAVEVSTGLIGARAAAPGIGTAEALRQTVLEMLERHAGDPRRGHPAYWAPFAVIAAR